MANTDKFIKGARRFSTTMGSGGFSDASATTGALSDFPSDYSDGDVVAIVVDRVNSSGTLTPDKEEVVIGVKSGSNLINCLRGVEGTAQQHTAGAVVEIKLFKSTWNRLIEGIVAEHNQDGTHSDITADSITLASGATPTEFSIDGTMAGNSDVAIPTEKAVKTYVDTEVAGVSSTDGWIDKSSETWTRTGNFSFTVPTDLTAVYTKGTKVRYKDGGAYEYGYVESSSYSAPDTTVTLVTNADYAMASATITNHGISYQENPQGFPEWFSFTTTFGGFSANPSTTTLYFKIQGLMCTFYYIDGSDGTSNATTTTLTLPVSSKRSRNMAGFIGIKDSGTISSTPGHLTLTSSSKTANAWKTFSQGAWTSSGAKNVFIPETQYEWT